MNMKKQIYLMVVVVCLSLLTKAQTVIPSYVPTNGLVGWWPFNGNANGLSINANNGTVNGASLTADTEMQIRRIVLMGLIIILKPNLIRVYNFQQHIQ